MSLTIGTLASGLRVVTDTMAHVESVSVSLTIGAGARAELEHEHGMAHLLEHMAFKGTARRSARQIAEAIESVGGEINAATSVESTVYSVRCLAQDLPLAVDLLADIVTRSVFDAGELAREKDVIIQEIAAVEDMPDDLVFDRFTATAFEGQAIGRPILGTASTVSGFSRDAIEAFLQREYRADRMVLSVAGSVDHAAAMALAAQAFGEFGAGAGPARAAGRYVGGDTRLRRRLEQAHLVVGFAAPGFTEADYHATQLFTGIAGGGMASRLFQEVRERRGLAYDIHAFQWSFSDCGVFGVYAGCAEAAMADVLPLVLDELHRMTRDLSEAELARGKAQSRAGLLMALESSGARADYAARHLLAYGRIIDPHVLAGEIEAIELEAVKSAGQRMLRTPTTLSAIGPIRGLAPVPQVARLVGAFRSAA